MSQNGVLTLKQHEEYYLPDGNVCFDVGDTLFRLHRHFFERESIHFRSQFMKDEGRSSEGPRISIKDATSDEFAQFVWVWYNSSYSFSNQPKEKWITILRLASQWKFDDMRTLAIEQIEKLDLDPIEKILLYRQYAVDSKLLVTSFGSLCRQPLPPVDEANQLGMETMLQLASAREQAIQKVAESGHKSPTTATVPEDILESIIMKVFLHPHATAQGKGSANSNGDSSSRPTGKQSQGGSKVDTPKSGKKA